MTRHIFTFCEAQSEFDYIIDKYEDFGEKERNYIIEKDQLYCSDTNVLLKGGKEWLIEPLRDLQPLSFAVLQEYASDYMVGFLWMRAIPRPDLPKDRLFHDGFFIIKDKVIWAKCIFDYPYTPYMPKEIQDSWLSRCGGWGTTDSIVSINVRQLVASPIYDWIPFTFLIPLADKNWEKTLLPSLQEKIPNVYVTQTNPYDGSKSEWPAFRCFLDSRLPRDNGLIGDQLYVVDENPDRRVYWIKDFDFKHIYYLNNPAEAIDAYSAHTLLQKPERFDFSPWGVRL